MKSLQHGKQRDFCWEEANNPLQEDFHYNGIHYSHNLQHHRFQFKKLMMTGLVLPKDARNQPSWPQTSAQPQLIVSVAIAVAPAVAVFTTNHQEVDHNEH